MKTSETINEIAAALAKAQSEMKNAIASADNPFFKSKYADLGIVRDAVTPALTKNGIAVVHTTEIGDGCLIVCTRLIHTSGQWLESQYPITADTNKPQAMGSSYTYARRYSLSAISGISSEKDDDGNEAEEHGKKAPEVRNIVGTPKASKAMNRDVWTTLVSQMKTAQSLDALREWAKMKRSEIEALPADWLDEFNEAYANHRDGLEAKAA